MVLVETITGSLLAVSLACHYYRSKKASARRWSNSCEAMKSVMSLLNAEAKVETLKEQLLRQERELAAAERELSVKSSQLIASERIYAQTLAATQKQLIESETKARLYSERLTAAFGPSVLEINFQTFTQIVQEIIDKCRGYDSFTQTQPANRQPV